MHSLHEDQPDICIDRWSTIAPSNWNDWQWQLSNQVKSVDDLLELMPIPPSFAADAEEAARRHVHFELAVTPYYANLLCALSQRGDTRAYSALLRTVLPSPEEAGHRVSLSVDGMGEDGTSSHPLISKLYKNRVLLFASSVCPVYCRYCFRQRKVGPASDVRPTRGEIEGAIEVIAKDSEIDDVIISGGDPLMMSDARLTHVLEALRAIPHVRIIRLDSKMIATAPCRITPEFCEMLARFHPLYVTLHFVHPAEITPGVSNACSALANAGVPLGAYVPLLHGVNDRRETLAELLTNLVYIRVRPYYLVHNIANRWNKHFTVPLNVAIGLIDGLQGDLSGPALPALVVYLPDAGGKVPLAAQGLRALRRDGSNVGWLIQDHAGGERLYKDPPG